MKHSLVDQFVVFLLSGVSSVVVIRKRLPVLLPVSRIAFWLLATRLCPVNRRGRECGGLCGLRHCQR